ncbi:MAG TPA: hypothetical protein VG777_03990 [Thermoanaerobaculia bacterium]|nr:hypothetical protein [Thermoanaerobaculia bacterium]
MKTAAFLGLFALAATATAAPVTREQLVAMAREKVDPAVMKAIVERDCVDFDVDAGNASDLSRLLPAPVLEAAIACRRNPKPAPQPPPKQPASSPSATGAPPAPPPAPAPASGAAAEARIRLRALFIGESDALRCAATIDGTEAATLDKEEQGKLGEAVERTKIGRESAYVAVAPGRHRVLFRCDPHAQSVSADVDVAAGESRTVEVAETMFRRWKLRGISKP